MKTRTVFIAVILGVVCSFLLQYPALAALGQDTPATTTLDVKKEDPAQTGKLDSSSSSGGTRTITLDVEVTDRSGRLIAGLQPTDFALFDNKQKQSLVSFHEVTGIGAKADPPVTVVLLVDTVNEWHPIFSHETIEWDELRDYFQKDGAHLALPTSLFVLTDQGITVQNHPSREGKVLADFLTANTAGLGAVDDRGSPQKRAELSTLSLRGLDFLGNSLRAIPGRKLILWLSLGWMDFSHFSTDPHQDDQMLFSFIASLSNELRDARITLYAIDPRSPVQDEDDYRNWKSLSLQNNLDYMSYLRGAYKSYLKGVPSPKQASYGSLLLPVLATHTGGLVLSDGSDLAKKIERCISDANSYYVLTFNGPVAAHSNEYHGIEIQMADPGLKARTGSGYYAQP
ncbi:MAG: VWA domain-containing protein [Terracidiphilus sp.]